MFWRRRKLRFPVWTEQETSYPGVSREFILLRLLWTASDFSAAKIELLFQTVSVVLLIWNFGNLLDLEFDVFVNLLVVYYFPISLVI